MYTFAKCSQNIIIYILLSPITIIEYYDLPLQYSMDRLKKANLHAISAMYNIFE